MLIGVLPDKQHVNRVEARGFIKGKNIVKDIIQVIRKGE
jgi:hypothetical protein